VWRNQANLGNTLTRLHGAERLPTLRNGTKIFFGPRGLDVIPDLSVGTGTKGSQGTGSAGRRDS
jgi:hypothetical protein